MKNFKVIICAASLFAFLLAGCIKDDIPYPRIAQKIVAIAAEGQYQSAYIDSIAYEATLYLDETVDIQNVKFTEFRISDEGSSDTNLLEGTYNLTKSMFITLSRYQDYTWEIKAVQNIERYFAVDGEIGSSVIDPVGHRVVVNMPEGTDLSRLRLKSVKLGPEGITTISPEILPGVIDLSYPLRVNVTCHDRTEVWTIYAQYTDLIVSTTSADAWSKVVWVYGSGPADVQNGFQYREASSDDWTDLPASWVTQTAGDFYAYIPHLQPNTEYVVRAVSGENVGNQVNFTTQGVSTIPNGDFEEWSKGSKDIWNPFPESGEQFWDTGNQGSITLGQNLTSPTTHTATGSGYAAECKTMFVGVGGNIGKLGAGSVFSGNYLRTDGTNGVLGFGKPWSNRPTKLKGYFQYQTKNINYAINEGNYSNMIGQPDTCHIYIALTDWTAPYEIKTKSSERRVFNKNADYVIGYGELQYSGTMNSYQAFEIPITYRSTSKVPTYIQITCSTSKYGDYFTGGDGAVLYVDQFTLDYDLDTPSAAAKVFRKK
jgi:hypothetical protein